MFPKLKEVVPLDDYKLLLKYTDRAEGVYDFAKEVGFYGFFEKLKDPAFFRRARISRDGWKALEWPGGLDLDPVTVYAVVTGRTVESIVEQDNPNRNAQAKKRGTVGRAAKGV